MDNQRETLFIGWCFVRKRAVQAILCNENLSLRQALISHQEAYKTGKQSLQANGLHVSAYSLPQLDCSTKNEQLVMHTHTDSGETQVFWETEDNAGYVSSAPLDLGEVRITPWVIETLLRAKDDFLVKILRRQANLDWGNMSDNDKAMNDWALRAGGRIFSGYLVESKTKIWVITERSIATTTVLLPDEY